MEKILTARWEKCIKCIEADAPLAAVVMMGGLLETLLFSKVNSLSNKAPVFTCQSAPKNYNSQKTLPLEDWTLRNYIDVAHELKWITQTAKDVGEVLRDYRNYIHPHKQIKHRLHLNQSDAKLFWDVSKNIARELA